MVEKRLEVEEFLEKAWTTGHNGFYIKLLSDSHLIVDIDSGDVLSCSEEEQSMLISKICSKGNKLGKKIVITFWEDGFICSTKGPLKRFIKKTLGEEHFRAVCESLDK